MIEVSVSHQDRVHFWRTRREMAHGIGDARNVRLNARAQRNAQKIHAREIRIDQQRVPFDEHEPRSPGPPQRPRDWICGEPLAFLIEVNGQRIYIDSGGTLAQLPPDQKVDLAILGMALPDSRERLSAALERLKPRYILPSHQDNFFVPLSSGFQFGPLTDFPRVQRDCARTNRSRLILMDYFRPWTLPRQ